MRRGRTGGPSRAQGHAPGARAGARAGRGTRLSPQERVAIALGLGRGASAAAIAADLGRPRQTIAREINRNSIQGVYRAADAQELADARLARPKERKIMAHPPLRERVADLLGSGHSPAQVRERLRFENPDDAAMRISHESIYQALYVQGAGSLRALLKTDKALRTGRTARIPRSPLEGLPRPKGRSWTHGAQISLRPCQAQDRAVPGHWEGDLVIGAGGRSALITLVERRSRYVMIRRLAHDHRATTVTQALTDMIRSLDQDMMRTLTWDQGTEMAQHHKITIATGVQIYFADPHSPWQRPTNENTNRLIRDYFPKGTRFEDITDQQVQHVADQLNTRARVVLQGMTPTEKLNTIINGATTT